MYIAAYIRQKKEKSQKAWARPCPWRGGCADVASGGTGLRIQEQKSEQSTESQKVTGQLLKRERAMRDRMLETTDQRERFALSVQIILIAPL